MSISKRAFIEMRTDADLISIFGPQVSSDIKSSFVRFNTWRGLSSRSFRIYMTDEDKKMVFSEEFKNFVGGYMAGRYFDFIGG